MKQLKVLPLVAIISGLMVGCGGGGRRGGRGRDTPNSTLIPLCCAQKKNPVKERELVRFLDRSRVHISQPTRPD
ncbi:hypothetical protein APF59_22225 [Vibrio parahaemolyticus]|nr:hypothetical protein APF59_22225 [Vibrio parahaemolyticus]